MELITSASCCRIMQGIRSREDAVLEAVVVWLTLVEPVRLPLVDNSVTQKYCVKRASTQAE